MSRSQLPRRLITARWSCVLALLAGFATSTSAQVPNKALEPFEPFLDRTWVAVVGDADKRDISRWERALRGQAIRMRHVFSDGSYGGETIVMWDRERQTLAYTYFTTAGFFTTGTMSWTADGGLASQEKVTGHPEIEAVEATHRLVSPTRLEVKTRMLSKGEWRDRGTVIYEVDDTTELKFEE